MNPFAKLFRRKPTPQEGLAILQKAIHRTLDSGLQGYVVGMLSDKAEGHAVFAVSGDVAEGLGKALEMLLENPATRAMAQSAIYTALKATGKVREVQIMGAEDCNCPMCTARRAKEERQATSTTH